MFKFTETEIKGVYIVEPRVFKDTRGSFMESYNKDAFAEAGLFYDFVQDNQNTSIKGVLRGLHFQRYHPQAKLARALRGAVFFVVVDLRKDSSTYGKWVGEILSDENCKQLLIPRGFAHGVLVLSDFAEFAYKCDDFYHPEDDDGIIWNDPDIRISWPNVDVILSDKDRIRKNFNENHVEFEV